MIDKCAKDINNYLEYLKYQKNYSDYTIKSYENDILEYFNYINSEDLNYKSIEYSDIRFFLMYLKDTKHDDNSSIDRKLSSLRGFYKYLANEGIVSNNVFSLVNGPKKSKKLPRYFEYNELEEMFSIPDINTALGQRDLLLLEMLYATGCRVGELVSIKVADIDFSSRTILIIGKGNKERYLNYGEYCEDILNKYQVSLWNGFKENDKDVLDGDSFSFNLKYGFLFSLCVSLSSTKYLSNVAAFSLPNNGDLGPHHRYHIKSLISSFFSSLSFSIYAILIFLSI